MVRWPKTTPIRRASSVRCRLGSRPATLSVPAGRHQDAGEHLDRGRLPGAVGADVADHLAGLDGERQVVHGDDLVARAHEPARLAADHERPAQVADLDRVASVSSPSTCSGGRRCARPARRPRPARAPPSGEANRSHSGKPNGSGWSRTYRAGYQFTNASGTRNVSAFDHLPGEDGQRVLRHRVAAVGEGVGDLAGVDRPELDAGEADEDREEDHRARRPASTASPAPWPASRRRTCDATPSTTTAWVIRANRRSANSSAHTWVSSGSGLTSIVSSRPDPDHLAEPLDPADDQVGDAEAERRWRRTGRRSPRGSKPPSASTVWNMIQIPTKSSRPIDEPADGHHPERRRVGQRGAGPHHARCRGSRAPSS